jgi:DHA1 family tetracycline resistance protein-like MFS transporter
MQEVQTQNRIRRLPPLLLIFLTILIDLIGFGIVIPILPLYAESPEFQASPAVIGWLMGSYSLAQLIFTPILGHWSDRIGRRPVLLLSMLGTALGFLGMGLANSLWLLFVARIFDGITGGNISTAQAYIADVTLPEERARGMGLIGAGFGLGFILGPAIGGELSRFGLAAPFYFAAALALFNAISIYFLLPESLSEERRAQFRQSGQNSSRFHDLTESLRQPHLRLLVLIYFVLTLAFATYQPTFSLFAKERYNYTPQQIGRLFVYFGLIAAIVQGGLIGRLTKQFGERKLLIAGLFVMLLASALVAEAANTTQLLLVVGLLTIGSALTSSLLPALISQGAAAERQGSVLGVTQSVGSLARFIGPAWGFTVLGAFGLAAPFWLCAALAALALILVLTRLD